MILVGANPSAEKSVKYLSILSAPSNSTYQLSPSPLTSIAPSTRIVLIAHSLSFHGSDATILILQCYRHYDKCLIYMY